MALDQGASRRRGCLHPKACECRTKPTGPPCRTVLGNPLDGATWPAWWLASAAPRRSRLPPESLGTGAGGRQGRRNLLESSHAGVVLGLLARPAQAGRPKLINMSNISRLDFFLNSFNKCFSTTVYRFGTFTAITLSPYALETILSNQPWDLDPISHTSFSRTCCPPLTWEDVSF